MCLDIRDVLKVFLADASLGHDVFIHCLLQSMSHALLRETGSRCLLHKYMVYFSFRPATGQPSSTWTFCWHLRTMRHLKIMNVVWICVVDSSRKKEYQELYNVGWSNSINIGIPGRHLGWMVIMPLPGSSFWLCPLTCYCCVMHTMQRGILWHWAGSLQLC